MTGLDVSARWDGSLCVLGLRGEARLETVRKFDETAAEVLEGGAEDVLVDLTHLSFMDSASAGSLLRLRDMVEQRDGNLVLFGMQRVIQRLLEGAGLGERFRAASDEAGAREMLH